MLKSELGEQKYISDDPLQFLKNYQETECFYEVLYTMGEQEIVKDNGKYYLTHTIYPNRKKEISCVTATELWQSYNMKPRSDVSLNFESDIIRNIKKK